MMNDISKIQKDLLMCLNCIGFSRETAIGVIVGLKTDEKRKALLQWMAMNQETLSEQSIMKKVFEEMK